MTEFSVARRTMVENQLRTYDVTNQVLLAAFEVVPREKFVASGQEAFAYLDRETLSRDGKTRLLLPMVVARMIQALELNVGEKVLDVGSAGYGAAVLKAQGVNPVALVADVDSTKAALASAGFDTVPVHAGNAATGLAAEGPYDAIIVHGAAEIEPSALFSQLKDDGALVIVMGQGRAARVTLFKRVGTTFSGARVIDAAAPVLPELARKPEFTF